MKHQFYGRHIICEGYNIEAIDLNNINLFLTLLDKGIQKANVTNCGTLIKQFTPNGITILTLLAESHISIHTYPDNNSLFLDIFTCGKKNPTFILKEITNYFTQKYEERVYFDTKILERGNRN